MAAPTIETRSATPQPLLSPLDFIACFQYSCTWFILAFATLITAGVRYDATDGEKPGIFAVLIVAAAVNAIIGSVLAGNDFKFAPDFRR